MQRPIEGDKAVTIINKIVAFPNCISGDEYYNRAMGVIATDLLEPHPSIDLNRLLPAARKADGPVRRLLKELAELRLYELPQDLRPNINESASQIAVSVPDADEDELAQAIQLSMAGRPGGPAVGGESNRFFNRQPVLAGAQNDPQKQQELSDKLYRGYYTNCDVVDMIVRLQQDLPLFQSVSPFKEDVGFIKAIKEIIPKGPGNSQVLALERRNYNALNGIYDPTLYMREKELTRQMNSSLRYAQNDNIRSMSAEVSKELGEVKRQIKANRSLLLDTYQMLYPDSVKGRAIEMAAREGRAIAFTREDLLADTSHQKYLVQMRTDATDMRNFLVRLQAKGCYMPMGSTFPDAHELNVQSRTRLEDAGLMDGFNESKQVKFRELRARYNVAEIQHVRGGGNCYYISVMQGHIQNSILATPEVRRRLFEHLANLIENEIIQNRSTPYGVNGGSPEEMVALRDKFRAAARKEAWPHLQDFWRDMETPELIPALTRASKYMLYHYANENRDISPTGMSINETFIANGESLDNYLRNVILKMDESAEGPLVYLGILPSMLGSDTPLLINPQHEEEVNNEIPAPTRDQLGKTFNDKYGLGSAHGFPYQRSTIFLRPGHYDLVITPEQQAKMNQDQTAATNRTQPFSFNVDPEIIPYIPGHPVLSAPVQLASTAALKAAAVSALDENDPAFEFELERCLADILAVATSRGKLLKKEDQNLIARLADLSLNYPKATERISAFTQEHASRYSFIERLIKSFNKKIRELLGREAAPLIIPVPSQPASASVTSSKDTAAAARRATLAQRVRDFRGEAASIIDAESSKKEVKVRSRPS